MAAVGFSGKTITIGGTVQLVVTSPVDDRASTISINVCNTTDAGITFKLFKTTSNPLLVDKVDAIEYNLELDPGDSMERWGVVLLPHENIYLQSDTDGVVGSAWGYTQP